jgi:hypothetical protein
MQARLANGKALVDRHAGGFAAAIHRRAAQQRGGSRQVVLQDHVDHARDRVRTILRRGAIAQHFDRAMLLDGIRSRSAGDWPFWVVPLMNMVAVLWRRLPFTRIST